MIITGRVQFKHPKSVVAVIVFVNKSCTFHQIFLCFLISGLKLKNIISVTDGHTLTLKDF